MWLLTYVSYFLFIVFSVRVRGLISFLGRIINIFKKKEEKKGTFSIKEEYINL